MNQALIAWSFRQPQNELLAEPAGQSKVRSLELQENLLDADSYGDFSCSTAMTFVSLSHIPPTTSLTNNSNLNILTNHV